MIVKQSILVVDDKPANLRLMAGILGNRDYMVRPVPGGELALSAAFAEPPDLILLDIMMPGMNGYEVCERLKNDSRTCDIPVIFLSAKSEEADKVKAFSVGGVDYITKPFQAEEVIARVQTHLAICSLQKQLEQHNSDLSTTLQELKATQEQMIHQEKMAALGQLIAGVAHEINTPLGAIHASISNVDHAVDFILEELPDLLDTLSLQNRAGFMSLVHKGMANRKRLSSREARRIRKALGKELALRDIPRAESVANSFVNMGVYHDIEPFIPLLQEPDSDRIVQMAYNLFMLKNNSSNIITAVRQASQVVLALKSYAHFDQSEQKRPASIVEGIEVVLTLYHNQLKRGIEVYTYYEEDLPEISCYPDELKQVWTNLIHNGIQAMAGKGRLDISVCIDDENMRIQFTDSGCGIPEEVREHIFKPFYTTKGAGEGSGLGLNIVQRIIEHHNGKIDCTGEPGHTAFTVFLPIER